MGSHQLYTSARERDVAAPILVVGAGPVGLVLAIDLARRGVPVRIIDALSVPTTESRALVIHSRSLEQLEPLGVLEPIVARGQKSTAVDLHAAGELIAHVRLDGVESRCPFNLTVDQAETEAILVQQLAALGVTVERGLTLIACEQLEDRVQATVRRADGVTQVIETPWLVGADGADSTVRGATGQSLEVRHRGENFLLCDVEAEFPYDRESLHVFLAPHDTPATVLPMPGRRVRVIVQLAAHGDDGRVPTVEWLCQSLAARSIHLEVHYVAWLTRFELLFAQVPRYRVGRVFLAGDAAHVHNPSSAQGIDTGVQDALNLSWKLALASRAHVSDVLLDSYHAERSPASERVISFTTKLARLGALESTLLCWLRDNAMRVAMNLPAPQRALANAVEAQSVSYHGSPIVAGSSIGARAGDFLHDMDRSVTSTLRSSDVARSTAHVGMVVPRWDGELPACEFPEEVRVLSDPTAVEHLGDRMGLSRTGGVVIVRPDGYIGLIAHAHVTDQVNNYFAQLMAA